MTIRDAFIWATLLDEHPLPAGCPVRPESWRGWWFLATAAQQEALQNAAVPLLAERWADAMEAALEDADQRPRVEDVASATLVPILRFGVDIRLTAFHYGGMIALLAAAWVHGDQLQAWFHHQLHAGRHIGVVD